MLQQAPPIQWLPVFDAAARHLNFKKAAEELCVSPPAISQQIKVLEEYLGIRLFERTGRRLKLTQAGEYYFQITREIIKRHTQGYRDFERTFRHPILQLSSPIFIAQELLIPNYTGFKHFAPEVELRLVTGNEYVNFQEESLDAALRFGAGPWEGLDCRLISKVELKLVTSQRYLDEQDLKQNELLTSDKLKELRLISVYEDFRDWLNLYPNIDTTNRMICDSYFSVVRSAQEGLGIAIGLTPIINRLINSNSLITLQSDALHTDYAYWLVSPKNHPQKPHIDALHNWLKELFNTLTESFYSQ